LFSIASSFTQLDGNVHFLSAAIHGHIDRIARTVMIKDQVNVELICDFLAVNGHDDIATDIKTAHAGLNDAIPATDTSRSCRTAFSRNLDQYALLNREIQRFRQ